jgi:multiple sugar transport system ATP-binding protein
MTMATRIVVMKDGLIQQVDTPQNLYDSPCNIFVAGFIGTPQMNFINGKLEKRGSDVYFNFENVSVKMPEDKANNPDLAEYIGKEVVVGLRPEAISDDAKAVDLNPDSSFQVDVDVTELMGAEIYLYLNVGEETNLIARVSSRSQSRAGDKIKIAFDMSRLHVFDKDTERCIIH